MEYIMKENCLDYGTYLSLRESVGWSNFCKEQAESAINNSYYSVIVESGSEAIGMGRTVGDGLYFTIVDVVVRPKYQGNGIGTAIIRSILKNIEDNMCSGSRVSVQLLSEIGKEAFYIKQGFKLLPHEYCGSALRKILRKL